MANEVILSIASGILPAILWLIFWLREDKKNPEPRGLVARTFLLGMLSVIIVIPIQKWVAISFAETFYIQIIIWAILEEVVKFLAGYFGGIHTIEDNEPLDPLVYMVTAALGFVALENTLFILGQALNNDIAQGIATAKMRFIGASLLHIVASGIVGASIAFSFYKSRMTKITRACQGLFLAVLFHSVFNLVITEGGESGLKISLVIVWIGALALLWIFERVKRIAPKNNSAV